MSYSLAQLCDLSGVTARTIRYYIQIGLLAAPAPRGRHTTYDDDALARLRAIRGLRDNGVPLDTIRGQLDLLTPAASVAQVPMQSASRPAATPGGPTVQGVPVAPVASAASVASVAPSSRVRTPRAATATPVTVATAPVPPTERQAVSPAFVVSGARAAEQWSRTVLVPGLEIHARSDAGPLVERLAREIIASYSVPTG